MIPIVKFNDKSYPAFQAEGFAAKFAFPFAKAICHGIGYDIGCNREEWALPGAIPIDLTFQNEFHAYNLPIKDVDYIFSSHCLEHLPNWVDALNYWSETLKSGGILFLYLPDASQEYWLPWNNRKHLHCFTPDILKKYFQNKEFKNLFISGVDLNNSFMIMAEKV